MTALPLEARYGRLTVLERVRVPGQKELLVACACDCGTARHLTRACSLKSGQTRSCGCLQREIARVNATTNLNFDKARRRQRPPARRKQEPHA